MTSILDIQNYLHDKGLYNGLCDGKYGPKTQDALRQAFAAGPDTPISATDVANAARILGTGPAEVRTVRDVEAAGAGFQNGKPKVLFEGHVFSKLTGHKFDATHPGVSYPTWDPKKYPATQDGRYEQIIEAVGLNPDAAFSAASWGAYQILGENYNMCGNYKSPFAFVMDMCQAEGNQLYAFCNFLINRRLVTALRAHDWATFAKGYNGSAYRANNYDGKLAAAYATESKR